MGKIKGFLFAVRHREILMTDLGLRSVAMSVSKPIGMNSEVLNTNTAKVENLQLYV